MSSFLSVFIIELAVLADYFWFDVDKKRWGWLKNLSKLNKVLFFLGLTIISILIYFSLSTEYF
ncbi:hypothetical protein HPT25_03615 [Bacillus sp. BRMEA1]|uniref:hypothetical protein n=1 Tax=Neobacillus endophyticus TaxID=2738405 RepID=UPI001563A934|nr:hypothetical protein [Neobacillus endophyticus]NRD76578.1 hypothetical protein [Neobacillus endophyticus]